MQPFWGMTVSAYALYAGKAAVDGDGLTGHVGGFFRAQEEMADLARFTDEELTHLSVARKYQIAQQCLYAAEAKPEEARDLVNRLGSEFAAWFEYVLERKNEGRRKKL